MTLHQLEYFQAVATFQHYHHAAEQLNVSQPSLSRSMAALEEELNVILFEKKGRNIVLTKPGRMFLEHVNKILDEVHIAQHKMEQLSGNEGHIDIAYVFPLANYYIPHMVRSFLNIDKNKHITFHFNQDHTKHMVNGLKKDEYDIIFCAGVKNEPEIKFIPILQQEMVIIMPKDHPLSAQSSVSYHELSNYTVIGYDRYSGLGGFTRRFFEENHLSVDILCECPDENAITALVAENFGISLVANVDTIQKANIEIRPLSDTQLTHTIYMGYLKDRYQIPVVKQFIKFVKQHSELTDH